MVAEAGLSVYFYYWVHVIEELRFLKPNLGCFHGSEVFFVFDQADGIYQDVPLILTPDEMILQGKMSSYWSSFIKNSNPNSPDQFPWPKFNQTTQAMIVLDETMSVQQNLRAKRCDFWDRSGFVPF